VAQTNLCTTRSLADDGHGTNTEETRKGEGIKSLAKSPGWHLFFSLFLSVFNPCSSGVKLAAVTCCAFCVFSRQIMKCPLCDKLTRVHQLPDDELVWQFPFSVALLGPWQYYTGYCVLISRVHITELHQMPTDVRIAYFEEMIVLSRAIESAFEPRKLNCESLGNQVPHAHWHLFPRRADDPDHLKPVWLALDRADRDEEEKRRLQTSPLSRRMILDRLREALRTQGAPTP